MRVNDAVFGAVLLAAALAVLLYARTLPGMPGQRFGPDLFPTLIALGLGACGLALVVRGLRGGGGTPRGRLVALDPWARSGGHLLDVALVLGGLVLLILAWDRAGFLVGATLYATALIARFRRGRLLTSLAVGFLACLLIDLGFRRVLLVPLPLGPLTGIVW